MGKTMDVHKLFESERHDPDLWNILVRAFDSAWSEIEHRYDCNPMLRDQALVQLADAVLKVVKDGVRDPEQVKKSALLILAVEHSRSL
jgi:hypothetical protein